MVAVRWQTREDVDGIDDYTAIFCRRLVSSRFVSKHEYHTSIF